MVAREPRDCCSGGSEDGIRSVDCSREHTLDSRHDGTLMVVECVSMADRESRDCRSGDRDLEVLSRVSATLDLGTDLWRRRFLRVTTASTVVS